MNTHKLDAIIAAPDSHRILFENERVRVLEVIIEPGKKEPEHIHELSSVMIVTKPAKIRYYQKDGSSFIIEPSEQTKTEWMNPEPLHAVENLDAKTYNAFRIELKK